MRVYAIVLAAVVVFGFGIFAEEESELAKVQRALVMLSDGTTRERADAAKTLGSQSPEVIESQGIIKALSTALATDVPLVKLAAIEALSGIYASADNTVRKSVKDALSKVIGDSEENPVVRAAAIRAVIGKVTEAAYDDRDVIKKVEKIAEDDKELSLVQSAAWEFLLAIGKKPPVNKMIDGLDSPRIEEQKQAVASLLSMAARSSAGGVSISAKDAADLLERAKDRKRDAGIRADLIAIVAIVVKRGTSVRGVPDDFEKMAKKDDEDVKVRVAAIIALGRTGDPDSAKAVLRVFEEQKGAEGQDAGTLRAACCEAAGEFFPMLAKRGDFTRYKLDAEKLIKMLVHTLDNDKYTPAVVAAAVAAGNLDPKRYDCADIIDALIEALNDPATAVKDAAERSLPFITGVALQGYKAWREWFDSPGVKERFRRR